MFGIGVALAVAAVVTIYVTSITSQRQASIGSSQATSGGVATSSSNQSAVGANSTTSINHTTTQVSIPQGAATQQVKTFYQPNPASVSSGARITWVNKDSAPHTATAVDNSFDTGIIQPGSSGSAIITGKAIIAYHCTIHPWMKASLIVASGG